MYIYLAAVSHFTSETANNQADIILFLVIKVMNTQSFEDEHEAFAARFKNTIYIFSSINFN